MTAAYPNLGEAETATRTTADPETTLEVGRRLASVIARPESEERSQAIHHEIGRLILSQATTAGDAFVLATWAGGLLRELCALVPDLTTPDGDDLGSILRLAAALTIRAGTALEHETGLSAAALGGDVRFVQ